MWTRKLGILVLALGVGGAATLPAAAQNPTDDRSVVSNRADDGGFDLGWLGLIGLAGLLALRRRDDSHSTLKGAANRPM